jgi:RNA polymerase sigma-70 factor (ECF subfamily)
MSGKKRSFPALAPPGGDLLRFLVRRVGPQDAPDLLQEAYLRVVRHAAREAVAEPQALLRAAAGNLASDHLRRRKTEQKYRDFDSDTDGIPSSLTPPDAQIEAKERLKLLLEAVQQLPPRCRQVFVMRRFGGLHQEEIARRLGISRNMVEKHMRLAIERLRAALD